MSPPYAAPGVYIEEITGPDVIAGVGTSTAAFLGPAADGPYTPKTITIFDDFKRHCLLNGLDDIGLTLEKGRAIDRFEKKNADVRPWA